MKKKIIKGTFWSSLGVALASLVSSLGLMALAPGTKIANLTPSLKEAILDNKNLPKNTQPTSDDLQITQTKSGWTVNGLTETGKGKKEIIVPNGVAIIGAEAFKNDNNLEKVTFPDGLISIEHDAFNGCSNLVEAIIPNSVTSFGESAFNSCSKLAESNVPRSMRTIPSSVFYHTNLKSLFIPNQVSSIGKNCFFWVKEKASPSDIFVMTSSLKIENFSICVANDYHNFGWDWYAVQETPWLNVWTINSSVRDTVKECKCQYVPGGPFVNALDPNNVKTLEQSGDIYYYQNKQNTDKCMAGLTEQSQGATAITVPSDINEIPEFVFTESYDNLKKIVLESDNIKFEKYSFFGVPKDVDYYVKTKAIAQTLSNTCNIPSDHIYFNSTAENFIEVSLLSGGDKILGLTVAGKKLHQFTVPQNVAYIGANAFSGHNYDIEQITFQNKNIKFEQNALVDVNKSAVYYVDGDSSCQTAVGLMNLSTVFSTNIYLSSQNDHDLVVRNRIDNNAKALVGLTDSGRTKTELSIPSNITRIDSDAFNNATNPINKITFAKGSQLNWIDSNLFTNQKLTKTKYVFDADDYTAAQIFQQKGGSNDRIILTNNQLEVNINGILTGVRLTSSQQNQKNNTTIVIPKNIGKVNIVGIGPNAFINCPNVLRIEFSDGINLAQEKISSDAFSGLANNPVVYVYSNNNAEVLSNITAKLEIDVSDSKSDIFTSLKSPAKFNGLTSHGKQQNQLDLPQNISWIGPYAFLGCSPSLREITIESDSLQVDDEAFAADSIKPILNSIKFHVSNDHVKAVLKEHEIKGNNIYVAGSNPLPLQIIIIITGAIALAIIILGLSIGLPMRKQRKITTLQEELNDRRIAMLSSTNTLAFKKVVAATGAIDKKFSLLPPKMKTLKTAVPTKSSIIQMKNANLSKVKE